MSPTFRRATLSDAPLMAGIAEQAYAPYVARMGGQRPAPMDADYETIVRSAEAWVAETDAEVIGFLVLVPESGTLLLDGVAVHPAHQGTGAGRGLLDLAEEQARAHGYGAIRLYTNEAMVENRRLYERIGYVETHRAHEDGFARVFYRKALQH